MALLLVTRTWPGPMSARHHGEQCTITRGSVLNAISLNIANTKAIYGTWSGHRGQLFEESVILSSTLPAMLTRLEDKLDHFKWLCYAIHL